MNLGVKIRLMVIASIVVSSVCTAGLIWAGQSPAIAVFVVAGISSFPLLGGLAREFEEAESA